MVCEGEETLRGILILDMVSLEKNFGDVECMRFLLYLDGVITEPFRSGRYELLISICSGPTQTVEVNITAHPPPAITITVIPYPLILSKPHTRLHHIGLHLLPPLQIRIRKLRLLASILTAYGRERKQSSDTRENAMSAQVHEDWFQKRQAGANDP